jgi:hypothetical protein
MSIQKKSLISNRVAMKKAMIASKPTEATELIGEGKPLTTNTLKSARFKVAAAKAVRLYKGSKK